MLTLYCSTATAVDTQSYSCMRACKVCFILLKKRAFGYKMWQFNAFYDQYITPKHRFAYWKSIEYVSKDLSFRNDTCPVRVNDHSCILRYITCIYIDRIIIMILQLYTAVNRLQYITRIESIYVV